MSHSQNGSPSPAQALVEALRAQHRTLATAESCTGGLLAKEITDVPGASQVFPGGVVSYSNQVKHQLLHVPQDLLDQFGAVSPQVARAMAEGIRTALGTHLGLATTGVAGPDPDDRGNPVGTIFVALAAPDTTLLLPLHLDPSLGRHALRAHTVQQALLLAHRFLLS